MAGISEGESGTIAALRARLEETDSVRAFAPLAEAYRIGGQPSDAVTTARRGLRLYPGHLALRLVLARALADLGEREEAEQVYAEVLEDDPSNVEARAHAGACEAARRDPAAAETSGAAEEGVGSLSEELAHLSELFVGSGGSHRWEPAEAAADAIVTITLAEIYARQGLTRRAVEVCEKILARDPDDAVARERLAEYARELADAE
jgi:tetratricopeptide (TPR) repeat protein